MSGSPGDCSGGSSGGGGSSGCGGGSAAVAVVVVVVVAVVMAVAWVVLCLYARVRACVCARVMLFFVSCTFPEVFEL